MILTGFNVGLQVVEEISRDFEALRALIDNKEEKLYSSVRREEENRVAALLNLRADVTSRLSRVQSSLDQADEVLRADDEEIVSLCESIQIKSSLRRLAQEQPPPVPSGPSVRFEVTASIEEVKTALSRVQVTHSRAPPAPDKVYCKAVTDTSATVAWSAVDGAVRYILQVSPPVPSGAASASKDFGGGFPFQQGNPSDGEPDGAPNVSSFSDAYSGGLTTTTISGLEPGMQYSFRVCSESDGKLRSGFSEVCKVTSDKLRPLTWDPVNNPPMT
jgi:hypothetical protein